VVEPYSAYYGDRIAGFWFDAGASANKEKVFAAVRKHNPNDAANAYNDGAKIPLQNNSPRQVGAEDFTFGHIIPLSQGNNPVDGCYNYGMVLSAEKSIDGYVF
jgi:hypothetical protein